jgi:uncharacterized protein YfaS (alpha-2-macroglobulin family)
MALELILSNDILIDDSKNLVEKLLTAEESPVTVDWPEVQVFWRVPGRSLRILTDLTLSEFQAALVAKPLTISLKPDLLTDVLTYESDPGDIFAPQVAIKDLTAVISPKPFQGRVKASAGYERASLTFQFNRPLVKEETVGPKLPLDADNLAIPFTFPDYKGAARGQWTSPETFEVEFYLSPTEYAAQLVDQKLALAFNQGFVGLGQEKVQDLVGRFWAYSDAGDLLLSEEEKQWRPFNEKAFYLDRFRFLSFQLGEFTTDGRQEATLAFNKPIALNALASALSLKVLSRSGSPSSARESANSIHYPDWSPIDYELGELGNAGLTVSLKTSRPLNNGNHIVAILNNLVSADGASRIAEASLKRQVYNDFIVGGGGLRQEEAFPWEPYFEIWTRGSEIVGDLKPYIRLEPAIPFTSTLVNGNLMRIKADFSRDRPVKIILLPGLRSRGGVLTEKREFLAEVEAGTGARLTFTGQGRYLSPKRDLLVKIAGREVHSVRFQAFKIYENNLPAILNVSPLLGQRDRVKVGLRLAKSHVDFEVPLGDLGGASFERLLDLKESLGEKAGAYLLKLTPLVQNEEGSLAAVLSYGSFTTDYKTLDFEAEDFVDSPQRYLPVVVSDLGLSAKVTPTQTLVLVTSLNTAAALPKVALKFYDKANQVIWSGVTDAKGLATANVGEKEAAFIIAEKDGDLSYLLLSEGQKDAYEPGFNVYWQESPVKWFDGQGGYLPTARGEGRPFLAKGYEAFAFLPRDLWKPGETIMVKAFIRDKSGLPPKEAFPVLWRVLDANDRTIAEGRSVVSLSGSLDFSAKLPFSIRVGPAKVRLILPGQEGFLTEARLTIEDFVPPRLALTLKPDPTTYEGDNPTIVATALAKYLFGAKGENLNYELTAKAVLGSYSFPAFLGFDFSGPKIGGFSETVLEREGLLDEEGEAAISFQPALNHGYFPNFVDVNLNLRVQADSGRWEGLSETVHWRPRPRVIGFKAPKAAVVGQKFEYELAAINAATGEPAADLTSLNVTVAVVKPRYYTEARYGRVYRRATEELSPIFTGEVQLAAGRAVVPLTVEATGEYQITASFPGQSEESTRRFRVVGEAVVSEEPPPEDQVVVTLDQAAYRPGAEAKATLIAPFNGTLWLTLETDEVLWSRILTINDSLTTVNLPVPKNLATNAMLSATLVRPLTAGQSRFFAYGQVSLEKDRAQNHLEVSLAEPPKLTPGSKTTIKIKLQDPSGAPSPGEVAIALVDEGILSLNGYRIPEPGPYFLASRSLLSHLYEIRDLLLPLEEKIYPFLTPGGGDERAGLFSPFQRRQELLTTFAPTVVIGPDGLGEVQLDIPEYSGLGRLTIVASHESSYGYLEEKMPIVRAVTVEPNLPLALAPTDRLEVPVRVYLAPSAVKSPITLSLSFKGPLSLAEEPQGFSQGSVTLDLNPGDSRVFNLKLKALSELGEVAAGPAELVVTGQYQGQTFSQAATTVVRPPYPRLTRSLTGVVTGPLTTLTPPSQDFLAGTTKGSFSLAAGPWVSANRASAYLTEYPYGCLEQTVSKAFAFLAAPTLGRLSQKQELIVKDGLIEAVKRLATSQTVLGGLSFWPGGSEIYEWGTVYAAHFLTEAKKEIELPSGLLEDALGYLKNYLRSGVERRSESDSYYSEYVLATKAYALYVLALNGEYRDGWINALEERSPGLSVSARINLAAAKSLKAGSSAFLGALDNFKLPDLASVSLAEYRSSLESEERNAALLLLAWATVDPLATRTKELAAAVAKNGAAGQWRTTQENAMALWALASYLKMAKSLEPYVAELTTAEAAVLGQGSEMDMATISSPELTAALDKDLTLKVQGAGRPWYALTVSGVPTLAPEPIASGLKVAKTWTVDGRIFSLSDGAAPDVTLAKGQKVTVAITLESPTKTQNVVVADLLPGGLEALNPRLDDESQTSARAEVREDRVIAIIDQLNGSATISYVLSAVTAGEFVLPPTVAEGMYQPEKKAVTPTGRLKVTGPEDDGLELDGENEGEDPRGSESEDADGGDDKDAGEEVTVANLAPQERANLEP